MKILTTAFLIMAIAVAGCTSKDDSAADNTNTGNTGPAPDTIAYFDQVVGNKVLFDTDQYSLDADDRLTLDRQAEWLNANAATNIVVEGHADERGTRQYNLALGARRSNAVRQYLISRGVAANRLKAVTFGKERPVAVCSDISCWSQNRRAVTVVTGAPAG